MKIKILKSESDHKAALARIEELFSAAPNTPECDELEVLGFLVDDYENRHFPVGLPDPIAAIRFRMDQQGLNESALISYLGSKENVTAVLSKQAPLTLAMIRNLVNGLGIPAESLLGVVEPKDAKQLQPIEA